MKELNIKIMKHKLDEKQLYSSYQSLILSIWIQFSSSTLLISIKDTEPEAIASPSLKPHDNNDDDDDSNNINIIIIG